MPTAALHSHYWATDTQETPPQIGASGAGGYVPWQTSVIVGGGFGVTQVVWEWAMRRMREKGTRIHGND